MRIGHIIFLNIFMMFDTLNNIYTTTLISPSYSPVFSYSLSQPQKMNLLLLRRNYAISSSSSSSSVMGEIKSDFYNALGVHLGIATTHRTRLLNGTYHITITLNFLGDMSGLCMSNTSYLNDPPEVHATGESHRQNIWTPFCLRYSCHTLMVLCLWRAFYIWLFQRMLLTTHWLRSCRFGQGTALPAILPCNLWSACRCFWFQYEWLRLLRWKSSPLKPHQQPRVACHNKVNTNISSEHAL